MKNGSTRREFISNSVKYGAILTAGLTGAACAKRPAPSSGSPPQGHAWPWPYAKLDPEVGRKLGHDAYFSGKGCSYGSFHAIIQGLREKVGEPYIYMPDEIMIYGHGGGAGWGGLCGALNGAAAAICLVTDKKTSDLLISELFGWYTQADLPTDRSNEYGVKKAYGVNKYDQPVPQSKSGSILCHTSGTIWCNNTAVNITDIKRKERCGRLTGDTVAYAIQILNDHLDEKFQPIYGQPQSTTTCNSCHGKGGEKVNVLSKMDCVQCHGDPHGQ
jgi:hypothetical protein